MKIKTAVCLSGSQRIRHRVVKTDIGAPVTGDQLCGCPFINMTAEVAKWFNHLVNWLAASRGFRVGEVIMTSPFEKGYTCDFT